MSDIPPEQQRAGPLAQEAALLLDVVADRLTSMKPGDDGAGRPEDGAEAVTEGATGDEGARAVNGRAARGSADRCPECGALPDASCTACPLCRFLAVLRGERPEATARLVDGALLIVRTLRSLIPEPTVPEPTVPEPAAPADRRHSPAAGRQDPPARTGGLEHIDIR